MVAQLDEVRSEAGVAPLVRNACMDEIAEAAAWEYLGMLGISLVVEQVDCPGIGAIKELGTRGAREPEELVEFWSTNNRWGPLLVNPQAHEVGVGCARVVDGDSRIIACSMIIAEPAGN
jgi:hypothetical protein